MSRPLVLEVRLHEKAVGTLTLLPGDRTLFVFDPSYAEDPNRPTLSLSFKSQSGELLMDVHPTQTRVPPFFSNLLPEGPLRSYLAGRAQVNEKREFFLLWALGLDVPGALTLAPLDEQAWPALQQDEDADTGRDRKGPLRFSLAGVQLKFSAIAQAKGGLTISAEGTGGSWIVKLPSLQFPAVPENEYSMMTLARAVGIAVPEVRLIGVEEIAGLPEEVTRIAGSALAVERFDRIAGGGKVHIEDFAQVFGLYPEKKYERASYRNIAEVIWTEAGEAGIAEFIRRLVFNTLIGNADMHLKNWSLIYRDRRSAALAPAYDLVSTIAYIPDENLALKLGRSKKMKDVSIQAFIELAAKARLPERVVLDTVRETVDRFRDSWAREHAHLPIDKSLVKIIDAHLKRMPLLRQGV